jgi:excisionase family DNA binding protein
MDDETVSEPTTGALLNKEQAAAYLGGAPITVTTIDGLVRRREIAFVKIGRATVFTRAALDAYVAAHTVDAKPNPWGLTDASLQRLRSSRPARTSRAS